jgi:hypothetical protein
MKAVRREEVPVAIVGDGVEFRRQEIGGDLTVAPAISSRRLNHDVGKPSPQAARCDRSFQSHRTGTSRS